MCKILDSDLAIKKLSFQKKGYFSIYLEDGRILSVPINDYADIEKLSTTERRNG